MITIKEIAEKAGVSPTTVSNVLNGRLGKVSPATLEKVQKILKEENYAPNMGAIMLAHNNSRIIGVILFIHPRDNETVLEDPFTSTIIGALEHEIRESGYYMMLHTTCDEQDVLRLAATWKLDGLVLIWVPDEVSSKIAKNVDTPQVFIDCYFFNDDAIYHNIGLDDYEGGFQVTQYLLSLGHTEIAFLANDTSVQGSDIVRFRGCRDAFAQENLILGVDRFVPLSKEIKERECVYDKMISTKSKITALVFSSDYYAVEAMLYFQERGVQIPEELSVTGFDNNIFGRLIRPQLTSVHQDAYLKGKLAVEMLMKLIKKEPVEEPQVRLPITLKIRDSVSWVKKN